MAHFQTNAISIKLHTIKQDGPLYIFRGHRLKFPKHTCIVFLSLKIDFDLVKCADPDEMLCCAAFHLGLHCLQKYLFRGSQSTKG